MRPRRQCRWRLAVQLLVTLMALGGAGKTVGGPPAASGGNRPTVSVTEALGGSESARFRRAYAPRAFNFPDDHGPHPDFRTEWWYFTGNLADGDGRRFGFQLTFFRFALAPEQTPPAETSTVEKRASAWGTRQVYMAHFALTDASGKRFQAVERFSRDALGLAGAQAKPFRVWLEDWRAEGDVSGPGALELAARTQSMGIELTLQGGKPLVLHGDQGLSRKSMEPGNASYYYSRTRVPATGRLWIGGRTYEVTGQAWLDREWSTSALGSGQAGWDWFALQLGDGRELMFYQLRRKDGAADPMSAGTLVSADGKARGLTARDVQIRVTEHWKSPVDGALYPAAWQVDVPGEGIALAVSPLLDNQELDLSVRYWEGAVQVHRRGSAKQSAGWGYVELTGYADAGKSEK